MNFTVYILYSETHDKYYIGQTKDLPARLIAHNEISEKSYTSKYRPWAVIWQMDVLTRSRAMMLEKYLKKKKRDYLKRLKTDKDLLDYVKDRFG